MQGSLSTTVVMRLATLHHPMAKIGPSTAIAGFSTLLGMRRGLTATAYSRRRYSRETVNSTCGMPATAALPAIRLAMRSQTMAFTGSGCATSRCWALAQRAHGTKARRCRQPFSSTTRALSICGIREVTGTSATQASATLPRRMASNGKKTEPIRSWWVRAWEIGTPSAFFTRP